MDEEYNYNHSDEFDPEEDTRFAISLTAIEILRVDIPDI